jgi:plastocyanin
MAFGLSLLAATGSGVTAQGATDAPHPSHIHIGTCADLDPNPEYPLADVAPVSADAAPRSIEAGVISLEVTLDELLASPFALNVHESAENIANYIACGDVVGPVVDGTLVIGLTEQNDSGYSGVAVFTTSEAGGTDVAVYLGQGLSTSDGSTSATTSTPAAEHDMSDMADAADAVPVSIFDFGFDGESVEVPVGTTVTWTNDGQVIHTTTSTDGLWDSDIMQAGDSFSYTFEEVGSFEYLCSLHPSMVATIVVTDS